MKVIGEGITAEVFEWEESSVLKLFKKGFDHLAENEYSTLKIISKTRIGSPEAINLIKVDGRNGIVMSRLEGELMMCCIEREPIEYSGYAQTFADIHNRIHLINCNSIDLPNLKERIKGRISRFVYTYGGRISKALELIDTMPDKRYICHNDYHPKNVIINDSCKVVDWGGACIGDCIADIAKTIVLITFAPPGVAFGEMSYKYRSEFLNSYIKSYSQYYHINEDALAQWKIIRACELLCLGVSFKEDIIGFLDEAI